jgi:hypothetical protein
MGSNFRPGCLQNLRELSQLERLWIPLAERQKRRELRPLAKHIERLSVLAVARETDSLSICALRVERTCGHCSEQCRSNGKSRIKRNEDFDLPLRFRSDNFNDSASTQEDPAMTP